MTLTTAPSSRPANMPAAVVPARASRRITALDGLRGFAILCVMAAHLEFQPASGLGVNISFVLSGFLITTLLLDEHQATGRVNFPFFYARRALRLFPALFVLIIVFLVVATVTHIHSARTDALLALLYASNWGRVFTGGVHPGVLGHTWSLSIEEQFYLLWPWCAVFLFRRLGRTRYAAVACLIPVLAIAIWRTWLIYHGAAFDRWYNGTDTRGDDLLAGAAMAFCLPAISSRAAGHLALWAGLCLLAVVVCIEPRFPWHWVSVFVDANFQNFTLVLLAALFIAILRAPGGIPARLLSSKPLTWTGKISYGLYLYHYPLIAFLRERHLPQTVIAGIAIPGSFLLATTSYYVLERPFLRLKQRFRSR